MTDEIKARLNGAIIVASVSGGKDSAATCLYLRELGLDAQVRRVFSDTGWEHPDTYTYLRGPLTACLGPIDEVQGRDGGMVNLIMRKGLFPSRMKRFCTEHLKVKPLAAYCETIMDAGQKVVNAVGIRAAESASRQNALEWEWSEVFDCDVWRPIVHWTEQQVIEIHQRHGLAPNPLYLRGAARVGCWPCIYARKKEIRMLGDESPERVQQIRDMEESLPHLAPTVGRDTPQQQTFFWGKTKRASTEAVTIDDAIHWANTKGTGGQGVLFQDLGQPEGCVKWGMCEQAASEEEEE